MNSVTVKVLMGLLSFFIILMVGSQIYFSFNDKFDYDVALEYSVSENVSFKGIIVRNETVIPKTANGVIDYSYGDGSKVSVGSKIAEVYNSAAEILAKDKIAVYQQEIENLKDAQNYGTAEYAQGDTVKSLVDEKYRAVTMLLQQGDYLNAEKQSSELLLLMNKYNVITEQESSYQEQITKLQNKIDLLKTVYTEPKSVVSAQKSGYFVSYTDGYESKLNFSTIDALNPEDIESVINNPGQPVSDAVGKYFDSYSCKIVGIINTKNSFIENTYMSIKLSSGSAVYDVYVESVEKLDDSDNCKIVLYCETLDMSVVKNRVEQVELIFDKHDGIKVSRKAIRFEDNVKGVYVIYGEDFIFKKINVIYEGDDYVLSEITGDANYLQIYDQIVLEGISVEKRSG